MFKEGIGMKEIKIKSAAPVYLAGLAWLAYASLLPLYRATDLIFALLVSAAVYLVSSLIVPPKTVLTHDDSYFDKTGDAEKDAVLKAGKDYLNRLEQVAGKTKNERMGAKVAELAERSRKIYEFVSKNNVDLRQIRSFANYYFPTAVKLAESYEELNNSTQTDAGRNVYETKAKIEGVMDSIIAAFGKQYDLLHEDKALDIKTDIEVLKSMLKAEGLDAPAGKGGGADESA